MLPMPAHCHFVKTPPSPVRPLDLMAPVFKTTTALDFKTCWDPQLQDSIVFNSWVTHPPVPDCFHESCPVHF